jgi:hypothetical protein
MLKWLGETLHMTFVGYLKASEFINLLWVDAGFARVQPVREARNATIGTHRSLR